MEEIITERLVLRPFREADYDDLYEFLSQLKDDEFEGYPDITYENGRKQLKARLGSEAFFAVELKESAKVIGNIYCGSRDYDAKEVVVIHFPKRPQNQPFGNDSFHLSHTPPFTMEAY